jgi:hypothetical protein
MIQIQNLKKNECLTVFTNGAITVRQRFKMQCDTNAVNVLVIEYWNLGFICNLVLEI